MELAIPAAFVLLFAAFLIERRWRKRVQRHNRSLRDQIIRQADAMGQTEAVNESLRLALVKRGGLVTIDDEWPQLLDR